MPTHIQYQIVKQQTLAFNELGCVTRFDMQSYECSAAPLVVIAHPKKSWRFSDPDWDVVSRQLATLYRNIRGIL